MYIYIHIYIYVYVYIYIYIYTSVASAAIRQQCEHALQVADMIVDDLIFVELDAALITEIEYVFSFRDFDLCFRLVFPENARASGIAGSVCDPKGVVPSGGERPKLLRVGRWRPSLSLLSLSLSPSGVDLEAERAWPRCRFCIRNARSE